MQMFVFRQDVKFNFSAAQKQNDLSAAHAALGLCLAFANVARSPRTPRSQVGAVLCLREGPGPHVPRTRLVLWVSVMPKVKVWLGNRMCLGC